MFGRRGLGCQARSVDRSLYRRPPAIASKLSPRQGLRGCYLQQQQSTTHRPGRRASLGLCAASLEACQALPRRDSTSFHCSHVTRRHVGQWLPPSSCSLMPDGCTRPSYLPERSPCIIVPRNKTPLIFPAEMSSHYLDTTDLAPRRHVLASTAHTNTPPPSHHHPTLPCPLVHAGPNPEQFRPRTTSTSRSLAFQTELLLQPLPHSCLQIRWQNYGSTAVAGLMITPVETHAGTHPSLVQRALPRSSWYPPNLKP